MLHFSYICTFVYNHPLLRKLSLCSVEVGNNFSNSLLCWIFVAEYHFVGLSTAHLHQARNSSIKWLSREHMLSYIINVTWQEKKEKEQSCLHPYKWAEWILTGSGLFRFPGSQLHDRDLSAGDLLRNGEECLKRGDRSKTEMRVTLTCDVISAEDSAGLTGSSSSLESPPVEARSRAFATRIKPVTGSRTPLREGREKVWWGSPLHRGRSWKGTLVWTISQQEE